MRKAKLIFLLAALAAAALFSCAVSESPASSDSGLVSMFREKLTEEAELSSSDNTQILPSGNAESTGSAENGGSANITETIPDESQTVYWTPGGSVYHSSKSCPSLAKSENVKSGTVKESGKSRLCKKCASR